MASFGFCVYETPDCVLRALRVIDGETEAYMEGVELEGEDGALKRLRMNVDASARKYAQKYLIQKKVCFFSRLIFGQEEDAALSAIAARKMGRLSKRQTIEYYNQSDEAQDERAYQEIQKILASMKGEKAEDFLSSLAPDGTTKESIDEPPPPSAAVIQALPMMAEDDPLSDLPPEITREQKEIIRREIILFRQNTAEKDREKRDREQRNVAEQRRRAEREFERERERKLRVAERRRLIAPNGVDITPGAKMLTKEDEEEERKRKEKRDEELLKAFKERERKWEAYEAERPKRLAAEEDREKDDEAHLQAEKEKAQAWLHSYNDDEEKDYDDFFRDRYAFDEIAKLKRERWVSRRQRDLAKEQDWDQQDALDEARESEEAAKAAQVVPEVSSVVGRIMTKEERVEALQELVQKIPIDKEGLWEWPIKWDYLTESLLEGKLRPFVSKKVVEYIGAEESDLVDYAIRAVASRAGAQAVLNELQGVCF